MLERHSIHGHRDQPVPRATQQNVNGKLHSVRIFHRGNVNDTVQQRDKMCSFTANIVIRRVGDAIQELLQRAATQPGSDLSMANSPCTTSTTFSAHGSSNGVPNIISPLFVSCAELADQRTATRSSHTHTANHG